MVQQPMDHFKRMRLAVTGRERFSGTLGDCRLPLLPASGPTVGRCRGEGKVEAEKNLVVSWPNYLVVLILQQYLHMRIAEKFSTT